MSLRVLNWYELEWEEWSGGPRFGSRTAQLAEPLGARKLGSHAEILPPGKASAPYHAHLVNEEMFLVLGGEMSLRLQGREYPLAEGDLVAILPGAEGVHQFLNGSAHPGQFLAASTRIERDVVEYPDAGSLLYRVGGLAADPPEASVLIKDERVVADFAGEPTEQPPGERSQLPDERDRRIVRLADVAWERFSRGGRFGGEWKRLGREVGARLLGYRLYRLEPGQQPFPFHFHHVNEELFYVRGGNGRLRTRDGTHDLEAGDAFVCPAGPEGAHAIVNTGDRPLEFLAISTMQQPEVVELPDSAKVYVMVGSAPGGDPDERAVDLVFRRGDAVDYMEGEG